LVLRMNWVKRLVHRFSDWLNDNITDYDPAYVGEDFWDQVEIPNQYKLKKAIWHDRFHIASEAYHEALDDVGYEGDWTEAWGNSLVYKKLREEQKDHDKH
jgi:hypothetical protein